MKEFFEINNPYTLQFSYIPPQFIERTIVTDEIISNFVREVPTYRGMFITGVRGSGKSVILSDIRQKISELKEWITVDINPETNLLDSLARGLYLIPELKTLYIKAKLDFSILGIGVHLEDSALAASNEEDALKIMLEVLKKAGKKVLVTIDEVTYGRDVARFSHALSSYAGAGYDIYVLMTGLADNIKTIQNQKSLTFLYRAKIVELEALNITAIISDYQKVLEVDRGKAEELAYSTRGYSLAFQAVGYHAWNHVCRYGKDDNTPWDDVYNNLDVTLAELAYDKIWAEYSEGDKNVLKTMNELIKTSGKSSVKVEEIRGISEMTSNTFTTYRSRLIESGAVDGKAYGRLSFKLPRFENYIDTRQKYD